MDCSFLIASACPTWNVLLSFSCESALESRERSTGTFWLLILLVRKCPACSGMHQVSSAELLGQLYH